MRFYPRNQQSRIDALLGPDHVSDHSNRTDQGRLDQLKRYDHLSLDTTSLYYHPSA